ncbi:MAG: hypothetical protein R3F43_27790 [bacterium]
METILEYLDKGGWMMYVILVVSIVGVTVFLERAFDLFVRRRLDAGLLSTVMGHVEARQFRRAIDACKVGSRHRWWGCCGPGPSASRPSGEGDRAGHGARDGQALPGLHRRVGLLGFLANSCTLLGLLGFHLRADPAAFASVSGRRPPRASRHWPTASPRPCTPWPSASWWRCRCTSTTCSASASTACSTRWRARRPCSWR